MKLKEIDIKTEKVYLNIVNGDSVSTFDTTRGKAVEEYGDLEARIVSEPEADDGEKKENGVTAIEVFAG